MEKTEQDPQDIGKINLANLIIWMQNNAYEPTTIKRVIKELNHIIKNCEANIPEKVKAFIAKKDCSNARKENLIESYAILIRSLKLKWIQPFYTRYDKKRRAPKEQQIDFIIQNVNFPLNLKLSMEKDLGTRPIELTWLKVKDIDLTTGTVSITGAKHTIGREGKIKAYTIELLKRFITTRNLNPDNRIFDTESENISEEYRKARNNLAEKTNKPELKQIQLYDFRRYKGSRVYHLSGGKILDTAKALGHKENDLRATVKYITADDYISWIPIKCTTDEEIQQAIKDDAILVGHEKGIWYFKKPA